MADFKASVNNSTMEEFDESSGKSKYLVMSIDEQEYAIGIEYVVDIINIQPITKIPNCPDFLAGITNLRGKVIPIIDMRLRFHKVAKEYNNRTCIIVLEESDSSVGLIIDNVSEFIDLDKSQIALPPSFNHGYETKFIQGVGKIDDKIKLILDCAAILDYNSSIA